MFLRSSSGKSGSASLAFATLIERNVFLVSDPDRFVALGSEENAVILVDAWSALTDPEQRTKQHLRSHWPQVDSVEADKNVWVYRFSR